LSFVAVVIPAYNESEALVRVLERMPDASNGLPVRVLVVDDGSYDATAAVARAGGAAVERHERNRGGGAALRTGFARAVGDGASVVVTLDADGQHDPREMHGLVEAIVERGADLAVGSRVLGAADPNTATRELGIAVFNRIVSVLTGHRVTDCSNSYRAIRADLLAELDLRQEQFHTSEFLIEALARGAAVEEVPVQVAQRTHGTTKKPRSLAYGFGFARAIGVTWLRTLPLRVGRPSRRSDHTLAEPERSAAGSRGG
jgi:glycosyltransferase involved in cell wall biosynthesis